MISEKMKLYYSQFVQAFWDRNLARLDQLADEFIAPNRIWHNPSLTEPYNGPEGQKKYNRDFMEGNTDIQLTIHDLVEAGDKMIWRVTSQFTDIASGNSAHWCALEIDQIAGDQIVEAWTVFAPGNW